MALAAVAANLWLTHRIKCGLRHAIEKIHRGAEIDSDTFWTIGPATISVLEDVTQKPYSISVRPFDWVESGRLVTHTAFVSSDTKEIRVRLKYNPFSGKFHIVGYATIRE